MSDNLTPCVQIQNLTKYFGNRLILDNVNFSIFPGKVHAFLGPNGAGKSTMMKIMAGILNPDQGQVIHQTKETLGALFDNAPLYPNMTVKKYLKFVLDIHGGDPKEGVSEVLEQCQLNEYENRLIRNLSTGLKQRVALAQAIVHRPTFIMLDEPTLGLDPHSVDHIHRLIHQLAQHATVLLSTHQLHEANRWCDDLTILHKGRVLATGPKTEIGKKLRPMRRYEFELEGDCRHQIEDFKDNPGGKVIEIKLDRGDTHCIIETESESIGAIGKNFFANELIIKKMSEQEMDLERIFNELTVNS